jgi:hypothetical protein
MRLDHWRVYGLDSPAHELAGELEAVSRELTGYWDTKYLLFKEIPELLGLLNRQLAGTAPVAMSDECLWELLNYRGQLLTRVRTNLRYLRTGQGQDGRLLEYLSRPAEPQWRSERQREIDEAWSRLKDLWRPNGRPMGFSEPPWPAP